MDWKLVCTIVHIVVTLVLIVIVLLQSGKDAGLSGALTGTGDSDSFFSKNRGKTKEGMLERLTAIMAALFIVSSLVLTIVFK